MQFLLKDAFKQANFEMCDIEMCVFLHLNIMAQKMLLKSVFGKSVKINYKRDVKVGNTTAFTGCLCLSVSVYRFYYVLVCLSVKDPIVHFERGKSNETAALKGVY